MSGSAISYRSGLVPMRAGVMTGTDLECAELPAELKHITQRRKRT